MCAHMAVPRFDAVRLPAALVEMAYAHAAPLGTLLRHMPARPTHVTGTWPCESCPNATCLYIQIYAARYAARSHMTNNYIWHGCIRNLFALRCTETRLQMNEKQYFVMCLVSRHHCSIKGSKASSDPSFLSSRPGRPAADSDVAPNTCAKSDKRAELGATFLRAASRPLCMSPCHCSIFSALKS